MGGAMLLYGKQAEQNIYARAVAGDLRSAREEILVTDAAGCTRRRRSRPPTSCCSVRRTAEMMPRERRPLVFRV